jgi:hypothetical protein
VHERSPSPVPGNRDDGNRQLRGLEDVDGFSRLIVEADRALLHQDLL